ncbi:MAG TPA: RNA polymerase sigma factor [Bryobacteraceae bacterium]|nr:RNA polymerase sigma factor [Bryobacteraceae bacterium]
MATGLMADTAVYTPADDFDAWMRAEQRRVFLLCWRMLADRDEADTATQDVFVKAYRATRNGAEQPEDPARWLTRVAVNTCLDRLRSRRLQFWRRRAPAETEDALWREQAAAAPDPEDRVFAREIERRLMAALARLTPRQRTVFTLRHFEDKSLEEIADTLGVDIGSVKSHMFRAVQKLRAELRELYCAGGTTK